MVRSLQAILAEQADRPLGDTDAVSGRTLQPFSRAGQAAADNLLDKAVRALEADDTDRARRYADRAARLPFDDHEEAAPAAWAAHLRLFGVVTDALEASEPENHRWLEAALAVLETAEEPARFDLRDVLADIVQDYELPKTERRRLRAAITPIPDRATLFDLDLDELDLSDHIMSILKARAVYLAELGALSA